MLMIGYSRRVASGLGDPANAFDGFLASSIASTSYASASQSYTAGRPLLLFILQTAESAVDNLMTVNIAGTHSSTRLGHVRRASSNFQVEAHYIASPPASGVINVTTSTANMTMLTIHGVHVAGMTAYEDVTTTSGTLNNPTMDIDTTGTVRKVLYAQGIASGATLAVKGSSCTLLDVTGIGVASNTLLTAWEDAPTAGTYQGQIGIDAGTTTVFIGLAVY